MAFERLGSARGGEKRSLHSRRKSRRSADEIRLEIFLKTKNANHFNFYLQDLGSGLHTVEVKVDSVVETSEGSPDVVVNNTRAVIGKRTLVIEEYNNP